MLLFHVVCGSPAICRHQPWSFILHSFYCIHGHFADISCWLSPHRPRLIMSRGCGYINLQCQWWTSSVVAVQQYTYWEPDYPRIESGARRPAVPLMVDGVEFRLSLLSTTPALASLLLVIIWVAEWWSVEHQYHQMQGWIKSQRPTILRVENGEDK
jgi:hypothetical protein